MQKITSLFLPIIFICNFSFGQNRVIVNQEQNFDFNGTVTLNNKIQKKHLHPKLLSFINLYNSCANNIYFVDDNTFFSITSDTLNKVELGGIFHDANNDNSLNYIVKLESFNDKFSFIIEFPAAKENFEAGDINKDFLPEFLEQVNVVARDIIYFFEHIDFNNGLDKKTFEEIRNKKVKEMPPKEIIITEFSDEEYYEGHYEDEGEDEFTTESDEVQE